MKLAALERHVFGQRSEKLARVADQLKRQRSREATLKDRRDNRAARDELPSREIKHSVSDEKRVCQKCGSRDLRASGEGKRTVVAEYIPARFERQVHVQETLSRRCGEGEGIVTADAPKAIEKGQYGPGSSRTW